MSKKTEATEAEPADLSSLTPAKLPDRDPPETYRELGGDYPVALLVGGLAVGLIVGVLIPRALSRKFGRNALAMATAAGELGSSYGRKVIDSAADATRDSREKLGEMGSTYGRKAIAGAAEASREGREKLSELGESAGEYGKAATTAASASAKKGRDLAITLAQEAIKFAIKRRR